MFNSIESNFEKSAKFSWKDCVGACVFLDMLAHKVNLELHDDGTVWLPFCGRMVQVAEFEKADRKDKGGGRAI